MSAQFRQLPDGYLQGYCPQTGVNARVHPAHQQAFAQQCAQAAAQQSQQYLPIGEAVARATQAFGIQATPDCGCAQRRAALNQVVPRTGWLDRLASVLR